MLHPGLPNHLLVYWLLLAALLLVAGVCLAHLAAWCSAALYRHKARRNRTIIAEYEPLLGLRPHELGYLYDNRFGDNELFAVLLELRRMGAIRLTKEGKSVTAIATKLADSKIHELSSAEQAVAGVIAALPAAGADWASLSSRTSEKADAQAIFESSTFEDLMAKGYLDRYSIWQTLRDRRTSVKTLSLVLAIILIAGPLYYVHHRANGTVSSGGFAALDNEISMFIVVLAGVVAWPVLYYYCQAIAHIYFRAAGMPVGATPQLWSAWPQIVGYREYLSVVETPRLRADPTIDNAMMAPCIALGCMPVTPAQFIGYDQK